MRLCARRHLAVNAAAFVAALVLVASAFTLTSTEFAPSIRLLIALLPIPFFVVQIVLLVRGVGCLDELRIRMEFEALALTVAGLLLTTATHGLLHLADIGVRGIEWSDVWIAGFLWYVVGRVISSRRYR